MGMQNFEVLAQYNIWATKKLNQTLQNVSDEDFFKDNRLFFKSIFATLNHLLLGEHYLWFARFMHNNSPLISLNSIIESDRHQLIKKLEEKSYHWLDFLQTIDENALNGQLQYKTSKGLDISVPYAATLLHVFNHATHHRGQITAALTAMGYPCPELDLIYMLIE